MNALRAGFSQYVALARGELRLTFKGAPAFAWRALIVMAWALAAIVAGSLVGFMAITLPPLAVAAYIGVFGLVLLWLAPDVPMVSDKLLRRLFFIALIVALCTPAYYSFHGISLRRIANYALVGLAALLFSTSPDARRRIAELGRANRAISACLIGYLFVSVLSILTSIGPISSLSAVVQTSVEAYIPFLAALYLIRNENDVEELLKVIFFCAIFITIIASIDRVIGKPFMVSVMPKFLYEEISANFPAMAATARVVLRGGGFRALAIFNTALSLAEFLGMIAPIAGVFVLHGRNLRIRAFGAVVFLLCFAGILMTKSRGGLVMLIASGSFLAAAWVVRSYLTDRTRLMPAILGVLASTGVAAVVFGLLFVPAVYIRVLGGGAEQYSNDGRKIEWQIGIPKIEHSPVIGNGFGLAADIIQYSSPGSDFYSVDSGALAVLVETGVAGAVAFFGALLFTIWAAIRRYMTDVSWRGTLMGGLAGALTAFLTYRTTLATKENFQLMYFLTACVMSLNALYVGTRRTKPVLGTGRGRRGAGEPQNASLQ